MEHEPLVREVLLNAPVSKVWKAITNKEDMKAWYFDIAEFRPEVGFEFQFEGHGPECEYYLHLCRITEVVPEKKLAYSWRYEGVEGSSVVTFELFPEGRQTRLRLTHEGLETFPANNPAFARKNFEGGWTHLIGTSIKKFVEETGN